MKSRQKRHHFGFMHFDMYVFSLLVQLSEGVIALSCIDPRPTFPSELAIILNGYSGELLFENTLRVQRSCPRRGSKPQPQCVTSGFPTSVLPPPLTQSCTSRPLMGQKLTHEHYYRDKNNGMMWPSGNVTKALSVQCINEIRMT